MPLPPLLAPNTDLTLFRCVRHHLFRCCNAASIIFRRSAVAENRALAVANPLATTEKVAPGSGTFPYGQQLVKYGYKENAECTLCKKAHEEIFKMWDALEKRRLGTLWDQEQ